HCRSPRRKAAATIHRPATAAASRPKAEAGARPSFLRDDRLEILAGHDQGVIAGAVQANKQFHDVALKRRLSRAIKRGKGSLRRAVIVSEDFQPMLGRAVTEVEDLPAGLDPVAG